MALTKYTPGAVVVLACVLFGGVSFRGADRTAIQAAPAAASKADLNFAHSVRPILQKYCVECHSGTKAKGKLRLDTLSPDFKDSAASWKAVEERVASRQMPPKSKPQPAAAEATALRSWIETGLTAADAARQKTEGRAIVRRLSRVEYVNTIRDLLAVEVPIMDLLPEDLPGADGFENDGLALRVSSVLIERYMEAADIALKAALIHGPRPRTAKVKLSLKDERAFNNSKRSGNVLEVDKAVVFLNQLAFGLGQFRAQTAGRYRCRVSAYAYRNHGQPMVMAVHAGSSAKMGGARAVGHFSVPADKPGVVEFTAALLQGNSITFKPNDLKKGKGPKRPKDPPGLAIEWVEVEGPLLDAWPPESYRRLLGNVNVKTARLADAEQALRTFIPKAFRRPASDKLILPYVEMVRKRLDQGYSFEEALQVALKAVLCSPHFLFLENKPGRLDDFALASRLSYFLWSSMPDAELFALAGKNVLHTPPVLREQVERMLKDPKSVAFAENFLDQWLDLRQIDATVPDKALYPEFGELLKISMQKETRLFFAEVLHNDLSLLNFVDSDFALLNEPLAKLYGIAGVEGPELRKVTLPPGSHRGGLLTQASVLKVTANGTTTSPVLRGVWLLKNILGQPVPPPPADVPSIEPDTRGAVTIRAQLAKHRQIESCAACHRKIDPLGFALENYDVMGGWRENYRALGKGKKGNLLKVNGKPLPYHKGLPVEAGDVMPDGKRFKDIDEFKRILLADPDQVARCVAEKLLIYGTGSDIRPADRAVVAELVKRIRAKNYGLRALLHEVVQSDLFLSK